MVHALYSSSRRVQGQLGRENSYTDNGHFLQVVGEPGGLVLDVFLSHVGLGWRIFSSEQM
jgi:hypothetical protein